MDPKMDSGHLEPGEALEDQYDIMREMLPEEVLGIMDQMLCYEVGSRYTEAGFSERQTYLMLIQDS